MGPGAIRSPAQGLGLGDDPDGLDRFADIMLNAAAGTVGLIKPQSAFFERHGWQGFRTLSRLIADARSAGLLVVNDVKRGDRGLPYRVMPSASRSLLLAAADVGALQDRAAALAAEFRRLLPIPSR